MIRRLHIGGKIAAEGWEIINAVRAPEVDHVGNANDLSQFADNTFAEMYASHVVEHLDYKKELARTLREWNRVLAPGGKIYISVPDLDVLARLFLDKEKLDFNQRYMVMRMIFGGHVDEYDYHVVGLNEDFLRAFLRETGYVNIQRVESFGLFADTSDMIYADVPISLNMTAQKPALSDEELRHAKVGRNDPCPCGSGKKFKKCHGQGA